MKLHHLVLSSLVLSGIPLLVVDCEPTAYPDSGVCTLDTAAVVDCSASKPGDKSPTPAATLGLAGYLCTGTARPDATPNYADGVPKGVVCDDMGDFADKGHGYCCNKTAAHCAYDPVAECDDDTYSGYQCLGTRPDFMNPKVYCRQGVVNGDYISYCCRDKSLPTPVGGAPSGWCNRDTSLACTAGLDGWACAAGQWPTSEEYPNSGSRSDFYYSICSEFGPAAANGQLSICCFTPKLPPEGASCEGRRDVPNCGYGRFGFACLGPDKPSDYHTPMVCNEPGFAGTSEAGYPETLYCCDYDLTLAATAASTTP